MPNTTTALTAAGETYFADLGRVRASGGATGERSSYGPLATLLNAVGATLAPKVFCVGELADQGAGHPDFGLYAAKQVQQGRPRERRVIGCREVKVQHPEDRRQEALSLAQWQVEDETERQCGFDREVRVLQLPSTLADARRRPRGDRLRCEPQGDVASLDQRSIVRRPVTDVVFRLILRMDSRLHVEIMRLRPSR